MKKKVGTILEEDVVRKLKEVSVHERKSISEVIQEALINYFSTGKQQQKARIDAAERLCSRPFNISREELKEILEEDYYDQ